MPNLQGIPCTLNLGCMIRTTENACPGWASRRTGHTRRQHTCGYVRHHMLHANHTAAPPHHSRNNDTRSRRASRITMIRELLLAPVAQAIVVVVAAIVTGMLLVHIMHTHRATERQRVTALDAFVGSIPALPLLIARRMRQRTSLALITAQFAFRHEMSAWKWYKEQVR